MKTNLLQLAVGGAFLAAIGLLSGCVPDAQPSGPDVAPPIAESAPDQCNGQPYWCVKVTNEASDSVQVYMDGQVYKTLDASKVLWVPIQAGSTHLINSCRTQYEGSLLFGKDVTKCVQPQNFTMDGNKVFVVYFTQ